MPSAKPSIFLGRRVYYRNEDDPMKRAMAIVGWQEAAKDAAATIIWDVETQRTRRALRSRRLIS